MAFVRCTHCETYRISIHVVAHLHDIRDCNCSLGFDCISAECGTLNDVADNLRSGGEVLRGNRNRPSECLERHTRTDTSAEHLYVFCDLRGAAAPRSLQHRASDECCNSGILLRFVARTAQCKHAEMNYLRAGFAMKKHGEPALSAIHGDARLFPL